MSERLSADRTVRVSIGIVDDDPSVRVALVRVCKVHGLRALAFESGPDFLTSFSGQDPGLDCLLLDAHMPGMTGPELQRQLIARGVRIPIIAFTADDSCQMFVEHPIAGVVACLRKPVSSEALFAAIDLAVRQGQPAASLA